MKDAISKRVALAANRGGLMSLFGGGFSMPSMPPPPPPPPPAPPPPPTESKAPDVEEVNEKQETAKRETGTVRRGGRQRSLLSLGDSTEETILGG